MRHYDVAVWRWWPSLFPEWCELVEAPGAFAAVEVVMRRHGCMSVQHAAACATDGLVVYRCFEVQLTLGWQGGSRRLVKHPWELEAGGAAPAGSPLGCRRHARPALWARTKYTALLEIQKGVKHDASIPSPLVNRA